MAPSPVEGEGDSPKAGGEVGVEGEVAADEQGGFAAA